MTEETQRALAEGRAARAAAADWLRALLLTARRLPDRRARYPRIDRIVRAELGIGPSRSSWLT